MDKEVQIGNKVTTFAALKIDAVNEPFDVVFYAIDGKLTLEFSKEKLNVKFDCEADEAAKAFFYQLVKPMADKYIAYRLKQERNNAKIQEKTDSS